MRRLVRTWDRLVRRFLGIRPARPDGVLGYAVRRYRGRGIAVEGGASLRRGDLVLELHLDSRRLTEKTAGQSPHRRILWLRRTLLADLRALARAVESDPALAGAAGLWGMTVLHRGVDALGFAVAEPAACFVGRLATWYMRGLLAAYHPEGTGRVAQRTEALVAREIFLPMERLRALTGPAGWERPSPAAESAQPEGPDGCTGSASGRRAT